MLVRDERDVVYKALSLFIDQQKLNKNFLLITTAEQVNFMSPSLKARFLVVELCPLRDFEMKKEVFSYYVNNSVLPIDLESLTDEHLAFLFNTADVRMPSDAQCLVAELEEVCADAWEYPVEQVAFKHFVQAAKSVMNLKKECGPSNH